MQVTNPLLRIDSRMQEFTLLHATHPDEQIIISNQAEDPSDIDEEEEDDDEDVDLEDDTRLRYQRLQARGRAAELAFNNRVQREKEGAESAFAATRSDSRSKSRSRTGPLSAVSNLFKLKPLSRSSSSKSIHNSSNSSSQATSPFPSPRTPLSPLPFFLSPKTRRKTIPNPGQAEDDVGFGSPLARTPRRPSPTRLDVGPTFGSPLTRTPRRPSPGRSMTLPTLPDHNTLGLGVNRHPDIAPLRRSNDYPATAPHLTY